MAALDLLTPVFAWNMYWAYETPQQQAADNRTFGLIITFSVIGIIWLWCKIKHNMATHEALLRPAPKQYAIPAPLAFAKIRDLLAETTYNFGDQWHVTTADTNTGRIVANLAFAQEVPDFDIESGYQTRYQKRFITLDILVTDQGDDTSIVQLDFDTRCEGFDFRACDSIILQLQDEIHMRIGST